MRVLVLMEDEPPHQVLKDFFLKHFLIGRRSLGGLTLP